MKTLKAYLTDIEQGTTVYYRGTFNPDEEELVKTKSLRPSINQITQDPEVGISVSDVQSVGAYFKYMYMITGEEVGEGSDGEPLLDPRTVNFLGWIKTP